MTDQLHDNTEGMSEECDNDIDVKDVPHCDPCKDEGIQLEAVTDNVPKSRPKKEKKSEQCQEHYNEPINWYCMSHDSCICDICKQVYHRNCKDVKSIIDVSLDFLSSDKLKKVKDRLTQLLKAFDEKLLRISENTESAKRCYATAIEEVTRNISKMRNEDLERMKALEVTCDTTLQSIRSVLKDIETRQQHDEVDQAFVASRKAESQLHAFGERLESVANDNKITKYRYVCQPKGMTEGIIGKMFAMKDRLALNIGDCNVKTATDTSNCWISGMERLSDNRLIIADNNNFKIKLVDMRCKTVISELKLDWKPCDLTRIDDNTIAVTTYSKQKIIFVSMSDTLTVLKTIDKAECTRCQGALCIRNTLIVSYNRPHQIQIMNFDGTVKQVIEDKDANGTVRFGDVRYLTQGPDTNILYISDYSSNKVSSITLDGQVTASFTHEHLKYPDGITVGKDGRLFVCCYHTTKIFEISSDLSEGQVILVGKDGLIKPYSVLYHDDECTLYVGSYNTNSIQVFQL